MSQRPVRGPGSNQHQDKPPVVDHHRDPNDDQLRKAAAVTADPGLDDDPTPPDGHVYVGDTLMELPAPRPDSDEIWVAGETFNGLGGNYAQVHPDDVARLAREAAEGVDLDAGSFHMDRDGFEYREHRGGEGHLLERWDADATDLDIANNNDPDVDAFVNGPRTRVASQGDDDYEAKVRDAVRAMGDEIHEAEDRPSFADHYPEDYGPPVDPDGDFAEIERRFAEATDSQPRQLETARLYHDSTGRRHLYRD